MNTEPNERDLRDEAMRALRQLKAIGDLMLLAGDQPSVPMFMDGTLGNLGEAIIAIANGPLAAYDAPAPKSKKVTA